MLDGYALDARDPQPVGEGGADYAQQRRRKQVAAGHDVAGVQGLPERQRQAPVQDLGVLWSRPHSLHGLGDILSFAEIFLGKASAFAVFPTLVGIIVVGTAVDGFGFEPLHNAPFRGRTTLGHSIRSCQAPQCCS